jgi:hypothetical protein
MFTRNACSNAVAGPAAIALGVAALLGLTLVQAATPPVPAGPPGPPSFSAMDANADGKVSADEFNQFRAQRMAARAAEGRPMRNAANAPTFESLDANGDGYLSQAEMAQHMAARGGCGGGPGAWAGGRPCGPPSP